MTYQEQIKAIEDYMDASLGVNGGITRKAEAAVREMKEAVSYDQVKWERDTAIDQLKQLGYSLGEKPREGDCISRQAAIRDADKVIERDTSGNNDVVKAMTAWKMYVEALPSAQPDHIAEVSKKDIPSVQPEQAAREMKAEDVPEINVGKMKTFTVFDTKTGREADPHEIALHEDWAKKLLCAHDMDGFAIMQDGILILGDECGNFVYCPNGRFEVKWDE